MQLAAWPLVAFRQCGSKILGRSQDQGEWEGDGGWESGEEVACSCFSSCSCKFLQCWFCYLVAFFVGLRKWKLEMDNLYE